MDAAGAPEPHRRGQKEQPGGAAQKSSQKEQPGGAARRSSQEEQPGAAARSSSQEEQARLTCLASGLVLLRRRLAVPSLLLMEDELVGNRIITCSLGFSGFLSPAKRKAFHLLGH